jgi:hypothetical protein
MCLETDQFELHRISMPCRAVADGASTDLAFTHTRHSCHPGSSVTWHLENPKKKPPRLVSHLCGAGKVD